MGKRREIWMRKESQGRCPGEPPGLGFEEALALRDEILVLPRVLCQDFGRGPLLDVKSGAAFSKKVEALIEANQGALSTCRALSAVGGIRRHLTVTLQAEAVPWGCPAKAEDGSCGLGEGRMPWRCKAGPFDPEAPEGLQDRSLLRSEGEGGVSRTPTADGAGPVWSDGKISHPGYAEAYAKRRRDIALSGAPADEFLRFGLGDALSAVAEDMPVDGSWEARASPVLWIQALLLAKGRAGKAAEGGSAAAAEALPTLDRWIAEAPGFCSAQAALAERLGLDPEPYRVAAAELALEP